MIFKLKMRLVTYFFVLICAVLSYSEAIDDHTSATSATNKANKLINEHVCKKKITGNIFKYVHTKMSFFLYNSDSNIFLRHREEQKSLLNHIRNVEDYAKQYKLLKVGLLKILEILQTNRAVLAAAQYHSTDGFPRTEDTIDAFALIFENTCLIGDLVLHTPEMSAKILAKSGSDWRELIGWSTTFVEPFIDTIVDEKSREMLSLFDQEINPERRSADYINPYHSANRKSADKGGSSAKAKKQRKTLRKGPQLSAADSNRIEL